MKLKEYDILIDLKKHKQIEDIEIVAGDYGSNIFNISVVEGINNYELLGLNIQIAFAKSDGTTVLQDMNNGIELIGNKIKCTLKTNTIASPGKVLAEIRILEGVKLLTTARFFFYVRKPIVDNDTVESTNEYPILGRLIEDVNILIDDIASKPEIRGYSAYQVWLNEGNVGTVDDYLMTLIGPPGERGEPGPEGPRGPTGSIDNLDKGNIEDALGYTPTKSINNILPDATGNITVELASDIEVVNNLVETVPGKALDATKGKVLKDELDAHKAENATEFDKRVLKTGDELKGVYRIGRDVYNLLESYISNDPQANGRKIKTNLVYDGKQIMTLHLVGFNFALREVVSIYIGIYNWDTPNMIGTVSSVNNYKPEIKTASEDGKLIIWINDGAKDMRWSLNAYNVNRDNSSGVVAIEQFQNWRVANETLSPTAKNVTTLPYKDTPPANPWINATLQNGWTGSLKYRKNAIGQLELSISVSKGVIAEDTIIATLPEGYRPPLYQPIVIYGQSEIRKAFYIVSGDIKVTANSELTSGINCFGNYVIPL